MNNSSKEEKILIKALIIVSGVIILSLFVLPAVGLPPWLEYYTPLLGITFLLLPILIVLYFIAVIKRYVDSRTANSKTTMDIHTKMAQLNESLDRIEKKLDKIDKILEKVSE
ncbi:hypothetical protein ANME2D_00178 [Candidatus Methanoperedens nitroreducens]|uniref:Uncharacterized protein n=1 Tax=Candidatus Methanoperedens nitratireducens TaxID=1392998 RepID=A0A062VBP3_9EURY|nr:hypothetical protein [Candidatus Methanoperedens nitroreducens]KCZ73119.1 hypothetical protein ANME2D_00178 [Candidatus Methanoperedens nitroreducens]MDJ1422934.1 hypothetical protein [Candidatus Methanoperedens sp.]